MSQIESNSELTDESILTTEELARILKRSERTLEADRVRGGGIPFLQLSKRCIRYRWGEVRQWLHGKLTCSTSEATTEAQS